MTPDDLANVLALHNAWLRVEPHGKRANLEDANLRNADLRNANLAHANLEDANLRNADLRNANLEDANLRNADLRNANLAYAILPPGPIVADLDRKIAESCAAPGALNMSDWHTCETTHCRAGWSIVHAGEEGKALEERFGPAVAGTLIYHASTPDHYVPNFYTTDATAMTDIMKRATMSKEEV